MIEFSIPELFSTNYSKLGEIILDATSPIHKDIELSNLVLTRFPGLYLFNISSTGIAPGFVYRESKLKFHTSLFKKGKLFF